MPPKPDIPADQIRSAVVMPCMVSDLFVLPLALISLHESNDPADEVLIVFSFATDLEAELFKVFPHEISYEVDQMRDQYRNFFLTYVKHLPDTLDVIGNSININREKEFKDMDELSLKDLSSVFRLTLKDDNLSTNIKQMIDAYPSYNALMDLPNLSIIVNQDEKPWCNASRFRGAWEAFGGPPHDLTARSNDIVQFLDCDDRVSPVRLRIVEETFRETPEAMGILHGYTTYNLNALPVEKKAGFNGAPIFDDDEDLSLFFKPTPKEEWTDEFVEEFLMQPFAIRDQDTISGIFKRQKKNLEKSDAMDPTAGNINGKIGTWSAFVQGGDLDPGLPPMKHWGNAGKRSPFAIQNGHPSFRHDFAVNTLLKHSDTENAFPNFRYGADSRLNWHVMRHGYKMLGLPYPLTQYTQPQGDSKKRLINGICKRGADRQCSGPPMSLEDKLEGDAKRAKEEAS